jgi:hypothetical protein
MVWWRIEIRILNIQVKYPLLATTLKFTVKRVHER